MVKCCRAGRPQMTIWRMLIAIWIRTATNTNSKYVIVLAFPQPQCLHERASKSRYTYTACLVFRNVQTSSWALAAFYGTGSGTFTKNKAAEAEG